jgi:hypothetical protein
MKRYLIQLIVALLAMAISAIAWAKEKPPEAKGAHRLVEVVYLTDRPFITEGAGQRWIYEALIAQGVEDSDIQDGSVALGRMYCCKPDGDDSSLVFYVPPDIQLNYGDIVEIRVGSRPKPKKGVLAVISKAVRIREKAGDANSACRWFPEHEGKWLRILTCDWMEAEGWVYYKTFRAKAWYKPAD